MSYELDYAFGDKCQWHGPSTFAKPQPDGSHVCPVCGQPVKLISEAGFWSVVNRNTREYIGMMRWSVGQCFPDHDAQMGAYRQWCEGRA